jgi:hypothetical protein
MLMPLREQDGNEIGAAAGVLAFFLFDVSNPLQILSPL